MTTLTKALLAVVPFLFNCSDSGSDSSSGPSSPEINITGPTTGDTVTVHSDTIALSGWAAIDAWSYDQRVEPNVKWLNGTTGAQGEAAEQVEWIYFFGYYPISHSWSASVPLVPGTNQIRVDAYYSGSGTVVGSDGIKVIYR